MEKLKAVLFLFLLGLTLASCEDIEEPELIEISKVELLKMKGLTATVQVQAVLENPNFFGIKIKPCTLEAYLDGFPAGQVILLNPVKMKRKTMRSYTADLELAGRAMTMVKLLQLAQKEEFELRLTGPLRGSVLGITKTIQIDEKQMINGSEFKQKLDLFNR